MNKAKLIFLYLVLVTLVWFLLWQLCSECGQMLRAKYQQDLLKREQAIHDACKGIFHRHGSVAISTDFTHFIRLNGEVCRIKEHEKPNF